jgi:hypothetical protein
MSNTINAILSHPLFFIPAVICGMLWCAQNVLLLCMFLSGFFIGPCQNLSLSPRHKWAYFVTCMFIGLGAIISNAMPIALTSLWVTIPFFLLMGWFQSWMLLPSYWDESDGGSDGDD